MFTTIVLTTLILDLARWLVTYLLYVVVLSTTLHGDLNWLVTTSKTMLQCISEYNNSWISIRGAMLILYLFLCLVIGYMPTIGLSLLHPITHESIYDRSYDVDISCLVKEIPTPLYTNVMSSLSGYFDERCDLHDFLPDPLPKQSVSPSIVQIDNDPALSLTYHSGSKYIFNTTTFTPDSLGVTLQAFIDADIAIDYFLSLRNYPLFNMDPLLPYHEVNSTFLYTHNASAVYVSLVSALASCDITHGLNDCALSLHDLNVSNNMSSIIVEFDDHINDNTMWIYAIMAYDYKTILVNFRVDIQYAYYSLWDNSFYVPKDNITLWSSLLYDLGATLPAIRTPDTYYDKMATKFVMRSFGYKGSEGLIHQFNRTFSDLRLSQLAMYLAAPSGSLRLRHIRSQDGYDTTGLIIFTSIIAAMSLISFIALRKINCLSVNNRSITCMIASATLYDGDQDWRRSGADVTINGRLIMALDADEITGTEK